MDDIELGESAWKAICGQDVSTSEAIRSLDDQALNQHALHHVYRSMVLPLLLDPSELFRRLDRVWAESHSRHANLNGHALAMAHNTEAANGLALAVAAIEQGGDVFATVRMLADALPLFERINVQDLLRFCNVAYPHIKNDWANGLPYNMADRWLTLHPEDVGETIDACLAAPSEAISALLRIALSRAAASDPIVTLDRIHSLRLSEHGPISSAALEALGLFDWSLLDRSAIDQAVAALREGLSSSADAKVFSSALGALWLVNQSSDHHHLIDEVTFLDKPFITRLVGDHLGFRSDAIATQTWFPDKIMLLARKADINSGSCHGVDHALTSFLKNETTAEIPYRWLDTWVHSRREEGNEMESFPRLFPQLFDAMRRDGQRLNILLIRWLLDADLRVQRAARDVLDELGHRNFSGLRVPREMLDPMSQEELVHLIRRLLGNVLRDDQLVALVWSLTDTQSAEARSFPLVHTVLADRVGYSYPRATRTHLEKVIESEIDSILGRLATATLQRMEHYYDELNALPHIEELKSPDDHRQRYRKASQRAMNQAYEEANKNSILQLIATKIPLKGGRSSFSRRNGQIGEKMRLSSFSHSMAFPRAEVIDSVGCAIERFHFQLAQVGDK
ncbi:MAG TPA: hypothetical protein VM576_10795 [Xanthomonadaceae bacterium]|nr:hypothetical protein [Xanthomonadaceae bacterium]